MSGSISVSANTVTEHRHFPLRPTSASTAPAVSRKPGCIKAARKSLAEGGIVERATLLIDDAVTRASLDSSAKYVLTASRHGPCQPRGGARR